MASLEELKQRMDRAAAIPDPLDRRLWVLGLISEALGRYGVTPILVGGSAVAFYTLGGYTTMDMDLVLPAIPEVDKTLRDLGFTRTGRHWLREDIDVSIEAPASTLAGDRERAPQVDVQGMPIRVIGVEDLIIDRLNAFVHWKSDEDGRWAARLMEIHGERIDWDYLIRRADEEKVRQAMENLRQQVAGD